MDIQSEVSAMRVVPILVAVVLVAAAGCGGTAGSSPSNYTVDVDYDGEWRGVVTVAEDGDAPSHHVNGTGPATIGVNASGADYVSVSVDKVWESDKELRVAFLKDGDVVTEDSTTEEWGGVSFILQLD